MTPKRRPVRKLNAQELLHSGLNLLAGRALTAAEVRTKLARKAENVADVDGVIARLRELGFLNDERFAEGYAESRRDSGSFGKMRVLRDLRQRRVAGSVAEKAVDEAFGEVDETAAVAQWLERKYRNLKLAEYLQDSKHLASAYRKLRYAGFSSSTSIRVLKRYANEADELAGLENED